MDFQNNSRFKSLLALGRTITIIGWVIVGFAGLTLLLSLASCTSGNKFEGTIGFIIGILTAGFGYLVVANGQIISCFVSIEDNTHKTVEQLNELKSQLPNFSAK